MRDDTLAPSLATDGGPAVAAVVADRAVARVLSQQSSDNASSGIQNHPPGWQQVCSSEDSAPPASVTRRYRLPLDGPILWRHRSREISSQLVSFDNPTGSINNSELELAGTLAGNAVLVGEADVAETMTATGTDNAAGLSWPTKGAVSTTASASYLLWLSSKHQQVHRYQQRNFFIPGDANGMADDCSRLWHLDDQELLDSSSSPIRRVSRGAFFTWTRTRRLRSMRRSFANVVRCPTPRRQACPVKGRTVRSLPSPDAPGTSRRAPQRTAIGSASSRLWENAVTPGSRRSWHQ